MQGVTEEDMKCIRETGLDTQGRPVELYKVEHNVVEPVPMRKLVEVLGRIRTEYMKRRTKLGQSDTRIRKKLCKHNAEFRRVAEVTHPIIFKMITDRNTPESMFDDIKTMIAARAEVESGKTSDKLATASMSQHFMEKYKK